MNGSCYFCLGGSKKKNPKFWGFFFWTLGQKSYPLWGFFLWTTLYSNARSILWGHCQTGTYTPCVGRETDENGPQTPERRHAPNHFIRGAAGRATKPAPHACPYHAFAPTLTRKSCRPDTSSNNDVGQMLFGAQQRASQFHTRSST